MFKKVGKKHQNKTAKLDIIYFVLLFFPFFVSFHIDGTIIAWDEVHIGVY